MTKVRNPFYSEKLPSWGTQDIAGYGDSSTWLDEGGGGMNFDWQQSMQGFGAGLSAGAANSQPVGDFNVDALAGFKGSGQGLASGGVIGAIVGGASAQYGQFKNVNDNLNALDTSVGGVTYDAYGRPVYQAGNVLNAKANIEGLNQGINKLNKTHLDPATNLISSFSGTRRKMKRKRAELLGGIQTAQQDYNQADLRYRDQSLQRQEYLERMNNNRLFNLYRY
jgi:hypothetical protein